MSYGHFRGIEHIRDLVFVLSHDERRTFRVLTYQSVTAGFLEDLDQNGVAIIDQDRLMIIAQGLEQEPWGRGEAAPAQVALFNQLRAMHWTEFRQFVNSRPETKHTI